jgi:hypothetical protein
MLISPLLLLNFHSRREWKNVWKFSHAVKTVTIEQRGQKIIITSIYEIQKHFVMVQIRYYYFHLHPI